MSGHHPSETTLLSVAAGILEAAGDSMLDDLPPTPVAPDALDRIMTRLDRDPEPMPRTVAVAAPSNLAELATGRWRWCGAGIHMMPLIKCDATDTRLDLIRVGPGMALLEHGHAGFETTVVLQGAFDDDIEHYHVGDFAEADGQLNHCPRALPGPDCICLIATSGRLAARGLLGKLVRPLLGK